jgi:hypothetical protein
MQRTLELPRGYKAKHTCRKSPQGAEHLGGAVLKDDRPTDDLVGEGRATTHGDSKRDMHKTASEHLIKQRLLRSEPKPSCLCCTHGHNGLAISITSCALSFPESHSQQPTLRTRGSLFLHTKSAHHRRIAPSFSRILRLKSGPSMTSDSDADY